MDIIRLAVKSGSKAFTYTLIESKDIIWNLETAGNQ
jgi:hypothetical protein